MSYKSLIEVSLQPGQVRSIKSANGHQILVVVAQSYITSNVCEVVLLGLNPDDATERDFCYFPSNNGLSFGVTIFCDYTSPVDTKDLERSPIVGRLCPDCISHICDQSLNQIAPFRYSLFTGHKCFEKGKYNSYTQDEFMEYKQSEYNEFWTTTIPYDDYDSMLEKRINNYCKIRKSITIAQLMESYSRQDVQDIHKNFMEMKLSKRLVRA